MPAQPAWETFQHDADVGVRGVGTSVAEAFSQAAFALTAVVTEPAAVRCIEHVGFEQHAPDLELLFLDWINALIFEMATRKLLLAHFVVEIDGTVLRASACGEPVDLARHDPAVEIKGATFTELKVEQRADGTWLAQCVVDV